MAENAGHVVIGGGVAGLASATALARTGRPVTLLEQAPAIEEVGAGLQISPNGLAVLRALGLEDAARAAGLRARAVVLRDYRRPGEVLRLDLAAHAPDLTYLLMHRHDLITLLADAARAAGVDIRLNARVRAVAPGTPAEVTLEDGAKLAAGLVVGADGLRSCVRPVLNGEDQPFFTGQGAWRAIVPNTVGLPAEAIVHMAPHRHLVTYPLRGGAVVNLVAIQERADWTAEGWAQADDPANLRAAFSDFEGIARGLIDSVRQVHLWGLFRHPVAARWTGPGVALAGDAAHPTLPFLAQGANLALEDAWVLADCLSRLPLEDGLAAYAAQRAPRARKVIAAANRNAWKYHVAFGPARRLGHMALGLAGAAMPGRMVGQFDWIYRHDVTRG